MGAPSFLQDLVVVMVVAAGATLLAQRLRQPVVLGYLVAGLFIGPHTGPISLISDATRIHELAELGLIFLLFSLGLEFNFRKVQRVGLTAVFGAVIEIGVMLAMGYAIGRAFGWSAWDSIFLGAILSISSTTIIVKVLMEQGKVHEEFAEVIFGILVVEDLLAVVLAGILGSGGESVFATSATALWVLVFAVVGAGVGLTLIPRFVEGVAKKHSEEILVVTVVGLAFASSLFAQHLGFSLALGSFIMGALIGESGAVRKVEHKVAPIRDLFASTFFVAVGMLLDPVLVWEHKWAVIAVTVVAVVGKTVACTLAVWLAGREPATAIRVGFSMGQIGEFSFIIAGLGLVLGIMSPFLYPVAVAVCALTTFTTPYIMRAAEPVVASVEGSRWGRLGERWRAWLSESRGPTGRRVAGRAGLRALVAAGWVLALTLGVTWLGDAGVQRWPGVSDPVHAATFYGVLLLVGFPALMFQRAAREIAAFRGKRRTLRHLAHPGFLPGGFRPAAILVSAGATAALLSVSVGLAWEAMPQARPPLVPLLGASVAAAGTVLVLWRRIVPIAHAVERIALSVVPPENLPGPLEQIEATTPWGIDAAEVMIEARSPAAFNALGDLDLRRRTGAIAAFVSRENERIPAPDPGLALLPGDRIVLIGRREQLARAREALEPAGPAFQALRRA